MQTTQRWIGAGLAVLALAAAPHRASAQAASIPSAAAGPATNDDNRGRKLLDQMVEALGGAAWLNRTEITREGQAASFYKGQPHEGVAHFIEYVRMEPFAERVVIVTKIGVFIPTDHRDVAEVWVGDEGYEITYKGKKELPKEDLAEFKLRRAHSLETVVKDWLKQPGVLVTFEGTNIVERHLCDRVSVLTPNNDAVELEIDEATHLPLSRSFQFRDPKFRDLDTDVEQYDDYHPIQGVMTPMNTTRLHNGEMVSQRFFTHVVYNEKLPDDLFDPDRPLTRGTPKTK